MTKPGQFTGKWEVYAVPSGTVLARNIETRSSAENLIINYRRHGGDYGLRRQRVPVLADISALDAGDID